MILRTGQKRNLIVAINAIVDLNAQMWGQYIAIQKITGTSIPLREIEKIIYVFGPVDNGNISDWLDLVKMGV